MRYKLLHILLIMTLSVPSLTAQTVSSTDTTKCHTMRGTFYSDKFVGRKTSSGEVFTQDKYTAAHRTFKFGTLLLVTNPKNGKQVIVRVNDRCPRGNIVDLTRKAAQQIDVKSHTVQVEVLPPRYYRIWEIQDQILDVLSSGRLREYMSKGAIVPEIKEGQLYNLELFRCKNIDEAKKRTERLPIYYQNQMDYKHNAVTGNVVAILELSVIRTKAELVKKELIALFPNIKVVEAK